MENKTPAIGKPVPIHYRRFSVIMSLEPRKSSYNFKGCQNEMERSMNSGEIRNVERKSSHTNRYILPGGIISEHDPNENNLRERIMERIKSATGMQKIPKNRVIDMGFILSGSREVFMSMNPERILSWASDSYLFMAKTYGEENIAGAVLHMDESNPHIHMDIVPIAEDGGKKKLCCRDLHKNGRYETIRYDYWKEVGERYGFDPMRSERHVKYYHPWELQSEWSDKIEEAKVQLENLQKKNLELHKEKKLLESSIQEIKTVLESITPKQTEPSLPSQYISHQHPVIDSDGKYEEGLPEEIGKDLSDIIARISYLRQSPKQASVSLYEIAAMAASAQLKSDTIQAKRKEDELHSSMKDLHAINSILTEKKTALSERLSSALGSCRTLDNLFSELCSSSEKDREAILKAAEAISHGFSKSPEEVFPQFLSGEKKLKDSVPWLKDFTIERLARISVPNNIGHNRRPSDEGILMIGQERDIPVNISYLTCGDSPLSYPRKLDWERLTEAEKTLIITYIEDKLQTMPPSIIGELRMMKSGTFRITEEFPYEKGEIDLRLALWSNNLDHLGRSGYFFQWSPLVPEDSPSHTKKDDIEYMDTVSSEEWRERFRECRMEYSR